METIVMFHNSKWYFPSWAMLFALCLILLWWRRKTWKRAYDTFFWLIIFAMIIVYCPLTARILVPRFLPGYGEYERLAWIFFEIPLISYTVIMLTRDFKDKSSRYLFVAAVLAVLILIGTPDNRSSYKKPENTYKITQDAVDLCDQINDLTPDGELIVYVQLDSAASRHSGTRADGRLYFSIRSYESRLRLRTKIVSPDDYSREGFKLAKRLPKSVDYYICPKAEPVYSELERLGYVFAGESEHYALFRNGKKTGNMKASR